MARRKKHKPKVDKLRRHTLSVAQGKEQVRRAQKVVDINALDPRPLGWSDGEDHEAARVAAEKKQYPRADGPSVDSESFDGLMSMRKPGLM